MTNSDLPKKGDKIKINFVDGVEEVEFASSFKAGFTKLDFVTLKRKHGAPYTVTISKFEKIRIK